VEHHQKINSEKHETKSQKAFLQVINSHFGCVNINQILIKKSIGKKFVDICIVFDNLHQ